MREILANLLHIFVIFMLAIFVIGGVLAATGSFDHWGERYSLKRRRRRLLRGGSKNNKAILNNNNLKNSSVPFASSNPDKETLTLQNKYKYGKSDAA